RARDLSVDRPCGVGLHELVQRPRRPGDAMMARLASSLRFVRARLFATPLDAAITLIWCWLISRAIGPLLHWPVLDATFRGATRDDCTGAGACWVFIRARFGRFMYGFYPVDQRWRVHVVGGAFLLCVALLAWKRLPFRRAFA